MSGSSGDGRLDATEVLDRVKVLDRGDRPSWPEIAQLIDEVESTGAWRLEGEKSFTSWVATAARRWRISRILLWRYRGAARLIPDFVRALRDAGSGPPEKLGSLPDPETLNLLMQIKGSVDAEQFVDLARRVLATRATRSEVRRIWAGIKRGRLLAEADADTGHAAFVARLVTTLHEPELPWLGLGARAVRMLQGWEFDAWPGTAVGPGITLVSATQPPAGARIHYLHPWRGESAGLVRRLAALVPYYDTCWAVTAEGTGLGRTPAGFGSLRLDHGGLEIVAQPAAAKEAGSRVEDTARLILALPSVIT